jgi:cell division protein FtsB
VLYIVSSAVVGYFVFHAHHGARGLEAKRELKEEIAKLTDELATLRDERASWEKRASMLRAEAIDHDVLEEQAREVLGFVHKNDVVVLMGQQDEVANDTASSATP